MLRNAYVASYTQQRISKDPEKIAQFLTACYRDWKKITIRWMLAFTLVLLGFVLIFKTGKILFVVLVSYIIASFTIVYKKRFYEPQRQRTFSFLPDLLKKVGIPQELIPFFRKFCLEAPDSFREKNYQLVMLLPKNEAYDLLKVGIRDANTNIRLTSMDMLSKHFPTKMSVFLPDLLRDGSPLVRMDALDHVSLLTDKKLSSRMVKELLSDTNALVRQAAEQAEIRLAGANTSELLSTLKEQALKAGINPENWNAVEKLYKSSDWRVHKLLAALFTPQNQYFIKENFFSILKNYPPTKILFALVDFAIFLKKNLAIESLIELASAKYSASEYAIEQLSNLSYTKLKETINDVLSRSDSTDVMQKLVALEVLTRGYSRMTKDTSEETEIQRLFAAFLNSPIEDIRNKAVMFFQQYADEDHITPILSILKKTKEDKFAMALLRILAQKMKIHQTDEMFATLKGKIQETEDGNEFRRHVLTVFLTVKNNDPAQQKTPQNVFCSTCYAKGKEKKVFESYSYIVCRKCGQTQSLIPYDKPVIGLVSQSEKSIITENTIQIQLWKQLEKKALAADIDELEIGFFEKNADLEWAVSAVLATLQNDLAISQNFKRKLQPGVQLSENLRRILEI